MGRDLSPKDAAIWERHMRGEPISAIAVAEQVGEDYARSVVTGVWFDDRAVMKNAA